MHILDIWDWEYRGGILIMLTDSSDICRRNVELDERKYLMGRGVVTETQSNMGKG